MTPAQAIKEHLQELVDTCRDPHDPAKYRLVLEGDDDGFEIGMWEGTDLDFTVTARSPEEALIEIHETLMDPSNRCDCGVCNPDLLALIAGQVLSGPFDLTMRHLLAREVRKIIAGDQYLVRLEMVL